MHSKWFDQIIIDPGFFYNKSAIHNLQVIKHLSYFKKFGYPIFIGLSRKSLILWPQFSKSTKSLIESYILTFECLKNWAEYVRVHDIEEMKHIQKIFNLYKLVQW
jgi:dihydropteroate synthase